MDSSDKYAGRLVTSLTWWLGRKRSFSINGEYKLELLHIDRENNSAKIQITNLKTGIPVTQSISDEDMDHE